MPREASSDVKEAYWVRPVRNMRVVFGSGRDVRIEQRMIVSNQSEGSFLLFETGMWPDKRQEFRRTTALSRDVLPATLDANSELGERGVD